MLVGKVTPGEAQLCADQGLNRRLNRIFDYRGLSYDEHPKISAVLQSNAGGSPAAEASEEPAACPPTKRKLSERSPKTGRTKKAVALRKKPHEAAPESHAETSPEGSAASRGLTRRESSEGAQVAQAPKSLFCSRVDLPTLILSNDEELTETGAASEPGVPEEPVEEGGDDVEVAAHSSPSSSSSSSSESEDSTPSAPCRRGKGLMGLGGLLDAKALAPEALRPAAFEPSVREVSDAKKIFGTFVLPKVEIPLAQKSSSELIDASDVAIAKVYRIFSYIDRKKTLYFTNL
ncbi:uncharacterized protein LOC133911091 [Phragmites australis]|uniref:uncharacterized protein LOC133911091 n=1 Tax=Phragmites australis TaxID=29695 RepID=UPI002D7939CE|nr:uncharacterized protein LOC133911091 [Phragmites australis]